MKHVAPPPPMPEPEWLRTFREIEARIANQVDRYVRWARRFHLVMAFSAGTGAFIGYWLAFGSVELLKWWLP